MVSAMSPRDSCSGCSHCTRAALVGVAFSDSRSSMRSTIRLFQSVFLVAAAGCARSVIAGPAPAVTASAPRLPASDVLTPAAPASVGMDAALPARLDSIVRVAVAEGASPGAAIAVGRYGRLVHLAGYGTLDYAPSSPSVGPETMYDLASLTKV